MAERKKVPVIAVKDLRKSFIVGKEKVEVLKGINLEVGFGEFVVIFGPSGCGKSTLLNTILGLEVPSNGEILIRGDRFYSKTDDDRAKFRRSKFGVIYQQPNWIKSLNVSENIEFPLHICGSKAANASKRAINILSLFSLDKYKDYMPTELSGGQQQRLAMCRALVTNPWIILADEPTGNLDTVSANDVMNIFKYLNDESKRTIIMVTHNPEYEQYATKIVYMRDGEITKIVDKKVVNSDDKESTKDLLEMALEL